MELSIKVNHFPFRVIVLEVIIPRIFFHMNCQVWDIQYSYMHFRAGFFDQRNSTSYIHILCFDGTPEVVTYNVATFT